MIKLAVVLAGIALAACTGRTYFYDGRFITCTGCCIGQQSHTTCSLMARTKDL